MGRFENLLSDYGVEWGAVAARFGGDEGLYLKCLGMFVADKNLDTLSDALRRGDLDVAFRAAHTIKGMSANMGFDGVTDAACAVVEPLRVKKTDVDYNALLTELSGEMRIIAELKAKADEYAE